MTHTKDNIALVKVPEWTWSHHIEERKGDQYLRSYAKDGTHTIHLDEATSYETTGHFVPLPPGSWRYIGLSTEMTEENAREVVELTDARLIYDDFGGTDYLYVYKDYTGAGECYNPIQSFASLLTALGCDPAGTYAVLINTNP